MGLDLNKLEDDLSTAKAAVAKYADRSGVSDEAKLIAAAVIQAGTQIALAVAAHKE
jgi:hypothetical protein